MSESDVSVQNTPKRGRPRKAAVSPVSFEKPQVMQPEASPSPATVDIAGDAEEIAILRQELKEARMQLAMLQSDKVQSRVAQPDAPKRFRYLNHRTSYIFDGNGDPVAPDGIALLTREEATKFGRGVVKLD